MMMEKADIYLLGFYLLVYQWMKDKSNNILKVLLMYFDLIVRKANLYVQVMIADWVDK